MLESSLKLRDLEEEKIANYDSDIIYLPISVYNKLMIRRSFLPGLSTKKQFVIIKIRYHSFKTGVKFAYKFVHNGSRIGLENDEMFFCPDVANQLGFKFENKKEYKLSFCNSNLFSFYWNHPHVNYKTPMILLFIVSIICLFSVYLNFKLLM